MIPIRCFDIHLWVRISKAVETQNTTRILLKERHRKDFSRELGEGEQRDWN